MLSLVGLSEALTEKDASTPPSSNVTSIPATYLWCVPFPPQLPGILVKTSCKDVLTKIPGCLFRKSSTTSIPHSSRGETSLVKIPVTDVNSRLVHLEVLHHAGRLFGKLDTDFVSDPCMKPRPIHHLSPRGS